MNTARAFTLIELLVALAIIAVLATLVLGVVNVAREHGDAAQCVSNLRQLATANLSYAAEHDGHYVPAQDETNTIRWHGVRSGPNGKFDPTKGPLAPYLGAEGRVKLCPALRRVLTGAESFEDGTGGYGYNAAYIGFTPLDSFTPEVLAQVPRPSTTMMFADCAFPRADGLQEYAYAEPWQWTDYAGRLRGPLDPSVHFRHGGYANVAWCDGRCLRGKRRPSSAARTPTAAMPGNGRSDGSAMRRRMAHGTRSGRNRELRSGVSPGLALNPTLWSPNPPANFSSNWSAKSWISLSDAPNLNRKSATCFSRRVAILALDMCGFSRTTRAYGIVAFLDHDP